MKELVLSHSQIVDICARLGEEITAELKDETKRPVIVGVMKGALNFMMELIPNIKTPIFTDYVQVSSWEGTSSTGVYTLKKDLSCNVEGRTIVLVEDIVDTGRTLSYLVDHLKEKFHPARVFICSLIDRVEERVVDLDVDFIGYALHEKKFLVGYGLDYLEMERNTGDIYVPDEQEIAEWDRLIAIDKQ